ncbi:MAG: coxL [Dehalococcoidia bacterium]|nr:coxL [Dehalococcoidia bacterium]
MTELSVIGKNTLRIDALDKVTGKAKYVIDVMLPGMLYGKMLRSPHPHARIINIDTSRAARLAGVKAVITGRDISPERLGFIRDRTVLAIDRVRFIGEPVAAVAAVTRELAEEAAGLIRVDYEPLPAVFDPEEAMKPNPAAVIHPELLKYALHPLPFPPYRFEPDRPNILIHRHVEHGDVEQGFKESDLVLEDRFSAAPMQHCLMEPHNCVAQMGADGILTVWTTTYWAHWFKAEVSRVMGLPPSRVRVISLYIGGNFGGRTTPHLGLTAALLALKTQQPVKMAFTREEVFIDSASREPMVLYIKDGVKKDGTLVAREMKAIINAGAYSSLIVQIARSSVFATVGVYRMPHFKFDAYAVATNEPPYGPFIGFGGSHIVWAVENHMDMLAEKLEMDPLEMRRRNLLKEADEDVCGQINHSTGARECLDKMAGWIEWGTTPPLPSGSWKVGKGVAQGCRQTIAGTTSVAAVKVHEDGAIEVRHSAHEVGQGCNTTMAQIAAEEFGATVDMVKVVFTDTAITPFEFGTVSMRSTFNTGNAVQLACQDAKRQLFALASAKLGVPAEGLDIRDNRIYVKGVPERGLRVPELFTPLGYLVKGGELVGNGVFTCPISSEDINTGQGKRVVAYLSHGANAAEVAVNTETGEVKLLRLGGCYDMGRPINPKACEAMIQMGLAIGTGTALTEEMVVREGRIVNPNFMDYKAPMAMDMPSTDRVAYQFAPAPHREGPYGAKGFAENTPVPVAPAIGNAVYHAIGVRIKDLPITKEKILAALAAKAGRASAP